VALPSEVDWLGACRRAASAAREQVLAFSSVAERAVETGRGEGGDTTLAVDLAAEDAVFAELEALGAPLLAISEERGEREIAGGGPVRVVIDPVDGSLNAKRGLPFACVSIAVASGARMTDVELGVVTELESGGEWWGLRGGGAFRAPGAGGPRAGARLSELEPARGKLELLGLETARPSLVAASAEAIGSLEARRLRVLGSVALSLCLVAAGRLDAMLSLREIRSVDVAAAQLIVREAGGALALPGGDALDLQMRSRILAARDPELLERLRARFG
jgi:myo-inositol-1(or 4)-monophosphatase